MERLHGKLASDIDFFRLEVQAENPDHWALVREHFRVGPRLPLLVLFAEGRWQRTLQGPAPLEVVEPFLIAPLGSDSEGNVL
ncbi:MAG TPA: hypothetical protein VD973_04000 [Symbiobacteriaceae bacterium]|nr:hypothetical protein [Symbiobacteriaceae bacterium]